MFLSSRGIFLPGLNVSGTAFAIFVVACVVLVAVILRWRRRRLESGRALPAVAWLGALVGSIAVAAALFVVLLRRNLASVDLVPRGDPYLEESLHHHQ